MTLPGGTLTPVTRVGDTVRRPVGFWSPSVHALLRHLEAAGFPGAPRVRGIDAQGREILTFLDGDVTIDGPPPGVFSDAALTAAGRLLRALHDATTGWACDRPGWQFQVGAPTSGAVICHNDVGPYNAVYRAGRPVAFIDWDFAAPGPPEWDVAYALWRFVPLYDDAACARLGWPIAARGPRIARFLDAYGLDRPEDLFDVVLRRMDVTRRTIEAWADAGNPGYIRLRREGRLTEITGNMRYVERSHRDWK
ncbi:phosphotransferase [Actinoplanes sp. NPDC051411]|jgi:aminoglycoside phosphotransferase (APT) family kinase protein|uniref:phosphotransferase n=1 Tax=Actinoplanes sp. NPDC051411 TaxID=3155522 RepID=UPI0034356FD8